MGQTRGLTIKTLLPAMAICIAATTSDAATYTFVGSWNLGQGPEWTDNPGVYSGQEAAALLFGGVAADYVISTAGMDAALINFSTWLDGWADAYTYGFNGTPAAQDFSLDITGLGYNGCAIVQTDCYQSAYSALVRDHFTNNGQYIPDPDTTPLINYAFRVATVPVPAAGALLLLALGALGAAGRARRMNPDV